ncbi:MBL fold metallo-hydrolase [Desulfobacula sp.]|uniref:MBL fold metallo-hydrolase n=1 Tax=Desulfobacula sp. TaxID=2593537 RepID=UPI00261AA9A2|nr:MBL fold metallo-hydrolase [Desulfobacula sp.]
MNYRISPLWWPFLAISSPVIAPWLYVKNQKFKKNRLKAETQNRKRIKQANLLDLPELDFLELTVLVEWSAKKGFLGDAGVSYLFKTDKGTLLFDVGFGPTRPAFYHNAGKLKFHMDQADALVISHLHCDHMGGMAAQRNRQVSIPEQLMPSSPIPCFLPDAAQASGFDTQVINKPEVLPSGIATTGPLARSLFLFGLTEEQALIARVKDKGLVVFTGCGHPTIEVILKMVGQLFHEPIYAIGGGLHFPISDGRGNRIGIRFQTIIGTGKPPWKRIADSDLDKTITAINKTGPKQVFLSGHDTCDHSLDRMTRQLEADTKILTAGETYMF